MYYPEVYARAIKPTDRRPDWLRSVCRGAVIAGAVVAIVVGVCGIVAAAIMACTLYGAYAGVPITVVVILFILYALGEWTQ